MKRFKPTLSPLALGLLLPLAATYAGATDLATSPLTSAAPSAVQANILYVLDDSGSMGWDFMPDHIGGYFGNSSETNNSKKNSCRSAGATYSSSGSFDSNCCQGAPAGNNNACWTGTPPFSNTGHAPFLTASFNGMAYNPAVRYIPPVDANGTSYPSQTSWTAVRNDYFGVQSSTTINLTTQFPDLVWCTGTDHNDCLRNDNYVLPGTVNGKNYTTAWAYVATGTGSVASGSPDNPTVTSNVSFGPHYYVITPGEYCTTSALRSCQTTQTTTYNVPAYVRWCNTSDNASAAAPATGACQATRTISYPHARYPTRFFTAGTAAVAAVPGTAASLAFTVSMNGCSSSKTAGVGTLVVNGTDLFGTSPTALTNSANTLASAIAAKINAKTSSTGYSATVSSATVTITAPLSAGNLSATASLTRASGSNSSCTFTPTTTSAFSGYVAPVAAVPATSGTFPGSFTRVDIVIGKTYPKASSRTDCAGSSCTYSEEMTNFANWWAYYRTRMQATKSAIMRAFASVGSNRRVGYMSIDNNGGQQFLNLGTFANSSSPASTQKTDWYAKITGAYPSSGTPLRSSLSLAGRLYGGKLTSVNGVAASDPVQYACQKNFTILSTDGFWNGAGPVNLTGDSIGDEDGSLARPMYDGNGTSDTLADTAAYYYNTDLRTGTTGSAACTSGSSGKDVCGNGQTYSKQNMVTFTLGLGVSGYMKFDPNYLSQTSGDYFSIKNGTTANPSADICPWQTSGACTWPTPVGDTLTAVDDLWHAAVNGGGSYFSASDPTSLVLGLNRALSDIDASNGAGAAAATSNPNVTSSDNAVYLTTFMSGNWTGEIEARTIDTATGALSTGTATWTAAAQLDAKTSRTIYMFSSGATNNLKSFSWASMNATEQSYFSLSAISTGSNALSQFCSSGIYCLSSADQTAAAGENLVNYLSGTRSNEGDLDNVAKFYRRRTHLLGDIANAESVFVGNKSSYSYTDAGYTSFKNSSAYTSRQRMLYVAANDGMLHAFNADSGAEVWAYVPTAVLPYLFQLADKQYSSRHRYFVDATPVMQDVYINGEWRTILVGGLGGGGRAYYALDVTDPASPRALWEYTDTNLGYTYGIPAIGKLADGTWAVFFGSGYNNVSNGDGVGRLYVLNAATGALIRTISTGAGSTSTPSGLAHVRTWLTNANTDKTVLRVYAGDTLGNVWRFDVNNTIGAAGYDAQLLATLRTPSGVAQPVTTRPQLANVDGIAMVYVGTGRYLGTSDYSNTDTQSIYAIKDDLTANANHGNPRDTSAKFVQQTLTTGTCPTGSSFCTAGESVRTNTNPQAVDLTTKNGWYVDLPASAERVNADPGLVSGTLVVVSNVISNTSDACRASGYSYTNYFDYRSGAAVATANGLVSVFLGDALSTRATLVELPNGNIEGIYQKTDGTSVTKTMPLSSDIATTRRLSWRDLNQN